MGLSAYGIMMKESSKKHHFSVRKQVVQWAVSGYKEATFEVGEFEHEVPCKKMRRDFIIQNLIHKGGKCNLGDGLKILF